MNFCIRVINGLKKQDKVDISDVFYKCRSYFAIFLAVIMILFPLGLLSCADEEGEGSVTVASPLPDGKKRESSENGIYVWDVYSEYVEITSYCGNESKVVVPDFLDNLPVMSIGEEAFANSSVESVELPKSVVNISDKAFYKCSALKSVMMPNVVVIGMSAFRDSALEEVIFPESLQSLGKYAFENTHIKTVSLPKELVFIGEYLFAGCTSLESFEINSPNAEISARMFYGCSSLIDVVISENIVKICDYAFAHCDSLKTITVPKSVTGLGFGVFYETPNVVIKTVSGTEAESYSMKNAVKYELLE